jgi:hypothetical protein
MHIQLLKPVEVDLLLRYPPGRSLRLAKVGLLPHVLLPDGEVRFEEEAIAAVLVRRNRRAQSQEAKP